MARVWVEGISTTTLAFELRMQRRIKLKGKSPITTYPKDQNSDACIIPLRGDSHLLTARIVNLSE